MSYNMAVIDIGKTNKKILVYDQDLKCIHSVRDKFEEYEKDGLIVEDMEGMTGWILDSFRDIDEKEAFPLDKETLIL